MGNLNSSRASNQGGSGEAKDLYVNQLMREINELKMNDKDYQNIASTVANLEKRYSQLKAEKLQSEQSNAKRHDELVDRLASLRTRIDEYKNKIMEKETECKNIQEDIEGAQRLHNSKKQSVDQLTFELDDFINKKGQLESELAELKNSHARLVSEREQVYTNVNLGNRKLEEHVSNQKLLEEENTDLEGRIDAKKRILEGLNTQIADSERDIDQIKADSDEKERDCGDLEKNALALRSKIEIEKRNRDTEKDELDAANFEFTKLLNLINELQLSLQKTQSKLRNKEKKLEDKRQETFAIESKTESLKTKNEEAEAQIDVLRNGIEKTITLCKEVEV